MRENEGYVVAAAVSWLLFLFFWSLGELLAPLRENYRKVTLQEETNTSWESPKVSKCTKLFILLSGESLLFPKFYTFIFFFIPAIIAIFTRRALKEDVKEAFFFNTPETEVLLVEQIILWESVYFTVCYMFTTVLFCGQFIPTVYDNDSLFERFPLQYHEKLSKSFALISSLLLVGATSSAIVADGIEIQPENNLLSLLKACICAAVFLIAKIGYAGYDKFTFWLVRRPGIAQSLFWCKLISPILFLKYISDCNEVAMYAIVISVILFILIPNVAWMMCSSKGEFPIEYNAKYTTMGYYYEKPTDHIVGGEYEQITFLSTTTFVGVKHWIWVPSKPWILPNLGTVFTAGTENDASVKMCFFSSLSFNERCESSWKGCVFVLTYPIVCLIYSVCCGYFHRINVKLQNFKRNVGFLRVSPPIGRSILGQVFNYDSFLFVVDGPGIAAALSYFNRYLIQEEFSETGRKVHFVFLCKKSADFLILALGILSIDPAFGAPKSKLKYTDAVTFEIVMEREPPKQHFLRKESLEGIIKKYKNYYDALQFGHFFENKSTETAAIIAIGSSYLNVLTKVLVARDPVAKQVPVFDVVFEDSQKRLEFVVSMNIL